MAYTAKNFDGLIGTSGFSETLLKNHFTLYQGYVANTNKAADTLAAMRKEGKTTTPEFAELKRRFGWEWNGMRLHELYFSNMKKEGLAPDSDSALGKRIAADFGSFDGFAADFKATGAMRGIGWVILYYDIAEKRLFNVWVNEHDAGHLSMGAPILVMDVFEHAFLTDYGLKRADYIASFWNAIDWKECDERLRKVGG